MAIEKIRKLVDGEICRDPTHAIGAHGQLEDGLYRQTCDGCGAEHYFLVHDGKVRPPSDRSPGVPDTVIRAPQ